MISSLMIAITGGASQNSHPIVVWTCIGAIIIITILGIRVYIKEKRSQ